MSRGRGRAASKAVVTGSMSRGGKLRSSPRNAKKDAENAQAPSNDVPVDVEGDRPSTQDPDLTTRASPQVDKGGNDEDVDDHDSMRTLSQTVNNGRAPSSTPQEPIGNASPRRRKIIPSLSELDDSEDRIEKVPPKKPAKPGKGRSTGQQARGKSVMKHTKAGQQSSKRSLVEGNGSEGDAVKKRRVLGGQERVVTESARSGQSRKGSCRTMSNRDTPSASVSDSQFGEVVHLLHDLKAQNEKLAGVLQTIVKKLDTQTVVPPSPKVKSEVVEVPVTPKRLFEDAMKNRMGAIDIVFNDDQFSMSAMKVIPRYILSLVDRHQNCIPIEKVPKLINSFLFSVPREMKGPLNVTDAGAACSYLRRTIIIDCLRTGPKLFSKPPHWLSSKMVGDRRVPYLDEKELSPGFDRRERCRGKNVETDSKRRRSIADGTIEPTAADDAEYIGYWAYGQLGTFFNKCRRSAIAMLFEHVTYLFVPWTWSTSDRRSSDSSGRQVSLERGGSTDSVIKDITSKKSLRVEWLTKSSSNNIRTKDIAMTKASGDAEACDDANHTLFMAIAKHEEGLQLNVEHDVLIHKSSATKGMRQRKGEDLKTFTHRISLMDSAAQFLIGFTGGGRTVSSHEMLKYTKKSLEAVVYLANAFRDIMEHGTGDKVLGPYGAIAHPRVKLTLEIAKEMEEMFSKMIPNDQIQGRVFNRKIWSVPYDIYKGEHCFRLMNAVDEDEDGSSGGEDDGKVHADNEYLLEDDEESDEQQEEVQQQNSLEDDRRRVNQHSPGYASKSVEIAPSGAAATQPPFDDDDEDDMAGHAGGERQDDEELFDDEEDKFADESEGDPEDY